MTEPGRPLPSRRPAATRPLSDICPFLALTADHRTALERPDRGHACHAVSPVLTLTTTEQSELCLTPRHSTCPRFEARGAIAAADASRGSVHGFAHTRLIVSADGGEIRSPLGARARPLALAAAAVFAAVLGVGTLNAIGGPGGASDDGARVAATPFIVALPVTPPATPATTPASTEPPAATPSAIPAATQPPIPITLGTPVLATPEPRQYVVVSGDTLYDIATRFGATVEAIMSYNGLESEFIDVDQVLLIP
ncbi:MAG: LysM peptidoglycan-binding domain-containing protein [Candidatus Limnocylindria bacterium]